MTEVRYTAKIYYKPSAPDDPIPWSVHLFHGERWVDQRWRGTREEAVEAASEMRWAHENQTDAEEIEV